MLLNLVIPGPSGGSDFTIQEPDKFKFKNSSDIGEVITALLPYVFAIAGIILFGFIIIGGFAIFTSGGNADKINAGKEKILHAVIGYALLFASYWIAQILEVIFNIPIL